MQVQLRKPKVKTSSGLHIIISNASHLRNEMGVASERFRDMIRYMPSLKRIEFPLHLKVIQEVK